MRVLNEIYERMIDVKNNRFVIQITIQKLNALSLITNIKLFHGDFCQFDIINNLDKIIEDYNYSIFDLVFIRNVFFSHFFS